MGTSAWSITVSKVEIVQVRVTEVDGHRVVFPMDQVLRVRLHFVVDVMDCVVLLSDVSPEFPNNTSSSFKVCLPHPVKFDGDGKWV